MSHHQPQYGPVAPTSWPLAMGVAMALFGYGAFEYVNTHRLATRGARGTGLVTVLYTDSTVMRVEGSICAVTGHYGHVGGTVPVAYPPDRPDECVVLGPGAYRWSVLAMIGGGVVFAIAAAGWSRSRRA